MRSGDCAGRGHDDGGHAAEPEGGTDREGPAHGDGPGADVREAGNFGAADVGAAECGGGAGADCGYCVGDTGWRRVGWRAWLSVGWPVGDRAIMPIQPRRSAHSNTQTLKKVGNAYVTRAAAEKTKTLVYTLKNYAHSKEKGKMKSNYLTTLTVQIPREGTVISKRFSKSRIQLRVPKE